MGLDFPTSGNWFRKLDIHVFKQQNMQATVGVFKKTKSLILNVWSTFSHYIACQDTPEKILAR